MDFTDPHRLSERAILASIVTTLRTQIVPTLDDPWTRGVAIQLAALAELLHDRAADPAELRREELAEVLEECGAPVTPATDYAGVLRACSDALAGWDETDPRRARLRTVLKGHLSEDLETGMPLLAAFRGQMPDA
jgi:hypothetical protein